MTITAHYDPPSQDATVTGDEADNSIAITFSGGASGPLLVNGGAVPFTGGSPYSGNTDLINVFGADGHDTISLPSSPSVIAVVRGGAGNDHIVGSYGPDSLYGEAGNDTLVGLGRVDLIDGGDGDDTIFAAEGYSGGNHLYGGAGNDWFYVHRAPDPNGGDYVFEEAGGGNDRVLASSHYHLLLGEHVEVLSTADVSGTTSIGLRGTDLDNSIYGNAGDNWLTGLGGNDTLIGHGGEDILDGAAGADNLNGGLGDDNLWAGEGDDLLDGGGGGDLMSGDEGDDIFYVDDARDQANEYAGRGTDRVFASVSYALLNAAPTPTHVEILSTTDAAGTGAIDLTGNELANHIYGNFGNNFLAGGGGDDTLIAHSGNDTLMGQAGADLMFGGLGDDWFYVDNAGDMVFEALGEGSDRVLASASYTLAADASIETLSTDDAIGIASIDLTGNELANNLYGNYGDNVLNGGDGNDTLIAHQGADTLDGGAGADSLSGGAGSDTFRFTTALGAGNVDTIGDYSPADDTIQLDDAVFTGLPPGTLSPGAFVVGTAAADADDRIIYDQATGALWFDADGNGAGAAVQFAALATGPAMTSGEFFVI